MRRKATFTVPLSSAGRRACVELVISAQFNLTAFERELRELANIISSSSVKRVVFNQA